MLIPWGRNPRGIEQFTQAFILDKKTVRSSRDTRDGQTYRTLKFEQLELREGGVMLEACYDTLRTSKING